jgi:hypothetical protein
MLLAHNGLLVSITNKTINKISYFKSIQYNIYKYNYTTPHMFGAKNQVQYSTIKYLILSVHILQTIIVA